ncbi:MULTISPECIES: hypothetical protein [unclassified Nostoc]|uniref:hypothetical protein n=1 Tax=unclassified Nostoc TaxID=2593658 RepID=UPI00168358C1|nr:MULTISPECIES: hypothetical protein [unclassified Nostoc]MBD2466689.1 hypothetical protein [Nostoc sp. FACHB-145]
MHKSDNESLQEIANGLKQLKQVLKHKNPKLSDISPILEKLGEQTTTVGQEAKRGFKVLLHNFYLYSHFHKLINI